MEKVTKFICRGYLFVNLIFNFMGLHAATADVWNMTPPDSVDKWHEDTEPSIFWVVDCKVTTLQNRLLKDNWWQLVQLNLVGNRFSWASLFSKLCVNNGFWPNWNAASGCTKRQALLPSGGNEEGRIKKLAIVASCWGPAGVHYQPWFVSTQVFVEHLRNQSEVLSFLILATSLRVLPLSSSSGKWRFKRIQ